MRRVSLLAAVGKALDELGRPRAGETIVAGLSGGADSVALLDVLVTLGAKRGFRVVAAHLDHGLRPASGDDVLFCRRLCERLGVPLRTGTADVRARALRERGGIEEAARRERYAFLHSVMGEEGAAGIAVAHTRDDQAETFLLRLLRGAGSAGLAAMRARSGHVLRPLLRVSREEVLAHLRSRGLPWREDPTNADTSLLRNRVRHELIPYLESRFNPAVRDTLARTALLVGDEAAALRPLADELWERVARTEGPEVVLSRAGLRDAPPALARMVVRRALEESGGLRGVSLDHVERVLELSRGKAPSGRRLPFPGGREVLFRFGDVAFGRRVPASGPFAFPLSVPGRVDLPGGLRLVARAEPRAGPPRAGAAVVPAPAGPLVVRTRRPGDRVRLGDREVSLKRFLMARRVPADLRARLPLVASGSRVLWVPGQPAGEARPGERMLRLELVEAR